MPIYMDRHDVSENVTAENVAQLHQEDLKIQHQYECRGLTYWFDDKRKTAFCLIEAPSENHIVEMHNQAHGEIPHKVIEVNASIVESFLGRIEDPQKAQNTELNIINDPAFRAILITCIEPRSLQFEYIHELKLNLFDLRRELSKIIRKFSGNMVRQDQYKMLSSFPSVSNAVNCSIALKGVYANYNKHINQTESKLHIGISAGVPVTEKQTLFEDSIKTAELLCAVANDKVVVTTHVWELFLSENNQRISDPVAIKVSKPTDEILLVRLFDLLEKNYADNKTNVEFLYKELGISKSQFYRKIMGLADIPPNTLLRNFRLRNTMSDIHKQKENISEIAFQNGFISPSYFTRCFTDHYGISPSQYIHTFINA